MVFSRGPKINNYNPFLLEQVVDLGFVPEEQRDGGGLLSLLDLVVLVLLCFWKAVLITVAWGCSA